MAQECKQTGSTELEIKKYISTTIWILTYKCISLFVFKSLYHSEAKTLYQQVWVPYFSLGKNNVINYVQKHCIISHYSCSINTWNIQSITVNSLWQQAVENRFLTAFVLGICYMNTSFNIPKNTSFCCSNFKHIVLRIHHSLHCSVLFFHSTCNVLTLCFHIWYKFTEPYIW